MTIKLMMVLPLATEISTIAIDCNNVDNDNINDNDDGDDVCGDAHDDGDDRDE